jgi:hypothetical protein
MTTTQFQYPRIMNEANMKKKKTKPLFQLA